MKIYRLLSLLFVSATLPFLVAMLLGMALGGCTSISDSTSEVSEITIVESVDTNVGE